MTNLDNILINKLVVALHVLGLWDLQIVGPIKIWVPFHDSVLDH